MKFFRNLSIKQRIQLVAFSLLLVLFLVSSFAVYNFSRKRLINTTNSQMLVYLNRLADIIEIVDNQSGKGLSATDLNSIKPIFSTSAYFKNDYPYIIDQSGTFIIHQYKEKQKAPREIVSQINSNVSNEGRIKHIIQKQGKAVVTWLFFKRIPSLSITVAISVDEDELFSQLNANRLVLLLVVLIGTIAFTFALLYVLNPIVKAINTLNGSISLMAKGELPHPEKYSYSDELSSMNHSLNKLIEGLRRTSEFAKQIGNNNLNAEFSPLGPADVLGNALLDTRNRLKVSSIEEEKRKKDDEQRNWINSGLAKFGDILRQNNNNLQLLSDTTLQNLIDYLNANQGGLFTYNDDDQSNIHLELVSAFAFNRKKFKQKSVMLGEGLVGNCAIEKQTIHLREIPQNYIEITSGLGDANPRSLVVVPLKLEDKIFGVIEIASFNHFQEYEIKFIEMVGESIASTLSAVRNNIRTNYLLQQSQQQREEMAAQEEEMRQNMEEMLATQEEMARKTIEVDGITTAINESLIFAELTEDALVINSNVNFVQTTEFNKNELEGKPLNELLHPQDANQFKILWSDITEGKPFKGSMRMVTRTGKDIYILASISAALDESGAIFKVYFLGQDISESKQLEATAQRQAEELEQALLEAQVEQEIAKEREGEMTALLEALDQICLVTLISTDKTIIYINNKNVEVLGDSRESIEGRNHSDLDQIARDNPEEYNTMWNNLLQGKMQRREFTLEVQGKKVWIMENYIPVHDTDGNINKIINIGIDITEFKDFEQELMQQIINLRKATK